MIHPKSQCKDVRPSFLQGSFKGSAMPHHVVNCHFDWCGTNSTAVKGVVLAVPGRCVGEHTARGTIRAYGSYCKKMGGHPKKYDGPWKWTNCEFDWCRPTETNRDTYVVSAPSRCPDTSRVGDLGSSSKCSYNKLQ